MTRLLLAIFILLASGVTAALELTPMQPYQSGPSLRQSLLASEFRRGYEQEKGHFLSVPLDYAKPNGPQTHIFVFTLKVFDASKPSMIYFSGGPGASSHGNHALSRALPGWNVIFFDQRGTGFSKPASFEILRDQNYTSSEIVARDANQIRQFYQIEKVSVYGHSYGTVPAMIFGHLFEKQTRAVVLEGVVAKGGKELWASSFRLQLLQRAWDEFPQELKDKVIEVSKDPDLPRTWFHDVARGFMYSDKFAANMRAFLEQAMGSEEPVTFLRGSSGQSFYYTDSFFFGAFTFSHIACRELGMTDEGSTWEFLFEEGIFTPARNHFRTGLCAPLGWTPDLTKTYAAKSYPLKVPVTYFQGATDGATVAPGALEHFNQSAKGSAQLYVADQGGHSPMKQLLTESPGAGRLRLAAIQVFESGLRGEMIPKPTWISLLHKNVELRVWRQYIKIKNQEF
ncbi:MAG: alpha/beta fold hydrolase [Bdellovibrio sp.]